MRAMAVVDYERPLELLDLPVPMPGDGEVLVRVRYCGVCYSDVNTVTGHMPYSPALKLPHVAGHEIAGVVESAGPSTSLRSGQRVAVYNYWACGTCRSCRAGEETVCLNLRGWVGLQAIQVARAAGGGVFAADVDARKLARARELGATTAPEGVETLGWLRDRTDGGFDLV